MFSLALGQNTAFFRVVPVFVPKPGPLERTPPGPKSGLTQVWSIPGWCQEPFLEQACIQKQTHLHSGSFLVHKMPSSGSGELCKGCRWLNKTLMWSWRGRTKPGERAKTSLGWVWTSSIISMQMCFKKPAQQPSSPVFPWASMSTILKSATNNTASSLYLS